MSNVRVDLMAYLFGDLLSVNYQDVISIFVGVVIVLICHYSPWRPLLSTTINQDMAFADGGIFNENA